MTIDLFILLIGTSIPDSRLTTVDTIDIEHEITITVCTWMDEWANGQTDGRTDGQTDGRTDGWTNEQMDGQMDEWKEGWTDGPTMNRQTDR